MAILTLNAGSSSIKVGLFRPGPDRTEPLLIGQVEGIGAAPHLVLHDAAGAMVAEDRPQDAPDHAAALDHLLEAIDGQGAGAEIAAIGHRVVHGGPDFAEPVLLDEAILTALEAFTPLAPLHQPHNLAGVRAAIAAFPEAPQIACFDTAFHRRHPWVNDTFALPRRYYQAGVRRYGFHGLSYEYVSGALRARRPDLAAGRVIIAHLGNGASMCAVRDGRSIGSTMGFSALDGLPMGTRSGQIDPGVILYMLEQEGRSPAEITDILYKQSGLKGLSGVSHDMRVLEASDDPAAAEAIDYFVFRVRREIGAMAAVLGGVDALVFTGGIGEHAVGVRSRVLDGMAWLGLGVDVAANAASSDVVREIGAGPVPVLVIPTSEERMIAAHVAELTAGSH